MGVINCNRHGIRGLVEVCEHIYNALMKGEYPEMYDFPVFETKVCKDCYRKAEGKGIPFDVYLSDLVNLPTAEADAIYEKVSPLHEELNCQTQCDECITILELKQAKKMGKKLPFETYENTLTYEDQVVIKTLKRGLLEEFSFQESKIPVLESKACFILHGSIYKPLEIIIYYIEKKETQLKILKYIDAFFENITKKQRIVSFYKAENWIVEKTENGCSERKGEDILLYRKID